MKFVYVLLIVLLSIFLVGCSTSVSYFDCEEFSNASTCQTSNAILEFVDGDIDSCEDIGDECMIYAAIITNDYSLCSDLSEDDELLCIIAIMGDTLDFETCYENLYAVKYMDAQAALINARVVTDIVDPITNKTYSSERIIYTCNQVIVSANKFDDEFCDYEPNNIIFERNKFYPDWNTFCLKHTTRESNVEDISECEENIGCLLDYAWSNKDFEACRNISNDNVQSFCLTELAIFNKNIDLCPKDDIHSACVAKILARR